MKYKDFQDSKTTISKKIPALADQRRAGPARVPFAATVALAVLPAGAAEPSALERAFMLWNACEGLRVDVYIEPDMEEALDLDVERIAQAVHVRPAATGLSWADAANRVVEANAVGAVASDGRVAFQYRLELWLLAVRPRLNLPGSYHLPTWVWETIGLTTVGSSSAADEIVDGFRRHADELVDEYL